MMLATTNSSNLSINTLTNCSLQHHQLTIQNITNINSNNSTEKMRSESNNQNQYLQHQMNNQASYMQMPNNNLICYSVANIIPQNNTNESNQIKMDLEEKDLWTRFYNLTNEMILTKAGRRTFPLIKIRLSGLEESALYTIQIEFRLSDAYKYRFVNGEWKTSPRNDNFKSSNQSVLYEHSDSPNFGHHWSKDSIAFGKLKLTNNENSKNIDAVFLKSLNKYDPMIHIYKHDKKNVDDKVLIYSKCFKETSFIAVTAYQNEQITNLKIRHNPFAKAFLNNKPIITIENDKVISTEAPKQREPQSSPIISQVNQKFQHQPEIKQSPQSHSNNSANYSNTNFLVQQHPILTPKSEPTQEMIQNWYNYYQQQASPIQQTPSPYQYQNNQIYQQYSYDGVNYPVNTFYNPYQAYSNDMMYQQNQYNQQVYAQQKTDVYQNDRFNFNQQYYPVQYDYNTSIESNDLYQSDRSKQSSPIYESYAKVRLSSNKRSSQELPNNDRPAPYSTARPAKRQAVQSNLSDSPTYNSVIPKFDFSEQSDESLNSSDNFLGQLHNQTGQSSTSSFSLSSSASSA